MSNNLNIFIKGARGKLKSTNAYTSNNLVDYYDIYIKKNNHNFIFNLSATDNELVEKLKDRLSVSFNTVNI
jgi:hypothetical protein